MYSAVVLTGELLHYVAPSVEQSAYNVSSVVSRVSHREVLKMVCLVTCTLATVKLINLR